MAECGPTLVAGRYRLIRELGRGGMGSVWEAIDENLDRQVAVKLMRQELAQDPSAFDRFEREAKAVARLRSPHIVQVHDYGVEPSPFIVMELLQGRVLQSRISKNRHLPLVASARIVGQIARALTAAHREGIIHRDLKPSNVFLVRDQDDEFVKVYDFGVAKALTGLRPRRITSLGAIMGTPRYMSPEQLRGDEVDARTDVWSLAVIAFRLLTGAHPFPGEELVDVVQRIVGCEAIPPTTFNGLLPTQLDPFFERALAKDRNLRFASAQELANALAEIAEVPTTSGFSLPPASGRPAEAAGSTLRLEPVASRRGWLALAGAMVIALVSGTLALRAAPTSPTATLMPIPAIEVPSAAPSSSSPPSAPSQSVPAPVRSPPKPAAPAKSGDDLFDSVF